MTTSPRKTNVARIRAAPETEALDLAGRTGIVMGYTTPSASKEPVVGPAPDDFAYGVYFEELRRSYFFRPELLEPVYREPSQEPPTPESPWRDASLEPVNRPGTPTTRLLEWLTDFLPRLG